jgi:hypothetical protein
MAGQLVASSPELHRVTPVGAQRGTEADVVLRGARLADAQELVLYYPGIRVVKVEPQKDGTLKARLAIAPDCRVGQHAVRIRTASGLSNLVNFTVGLLPTVKEVEPNSEFDKPQKIPMNVTVHGTVENEDVDYFLVEAKKGQRLTAEIEGERLGITFFDPSVSIFDANRFALAAADDTPLVREDAVASAVVPKDGPYLIQVRECAFGGSGDCHYRLHVGDFPRPLAAYPAGGRPGETIEVRWLGDPLGEWTERITLPTGPNAIYEHQARSPQGLAVTPNILRVVDLPNTLEVEPNETPAQATPAAAPGAFNGILTKPGDVDCFKFSAKKGQVFDVRVHARSIRLPVDPVLTILRSNGAGIASNDDTDTPDSYLRFTAPDDDQYVVMVHDQLRQGGPEYVYRAEVTPVQPRLTLGLPERSQFVDITAPVPAGNRLAMIVSAQREDYGGEVKLEVRGLPPGITAQIEPIGPNDSTVPVLLSAAADAKPAGALVDLVGRSAVGPQTVEGHLRQRTSLVRGDNNREVCNHITDRMAAAVTQPVPFSVEIVEPKVPLVQNGSMELKIRAKRNEGYKAPIQLRMLYNPTGVSTPSVVTLPEGQSEVAMPLTADGGAAVRVWKIAVIAEAPVGDGPVVVSSQLAKLEVAEPFFKFTLPTVSVDQGQQGAMAIKVEKRKDFAGPVKAEIVGLPNEAASTPQEFTKDAAEVVFPVKTTQKSPIGNHKSVLCRAVLTLNGEPVTHLQGTGELRIQQPLPPKKTDAAPPKPAAPPPKTEAPKKTLSRLEQLRLEREKAK